MNARIVLGLVALSFVVSTPSFAARRTARNAVTTCSNAKLDFGFILVSAGRGDKFSIQTQTLGGPIQVAIATCQSVDGQGQAVAQGVPGFRGRPVVGADTMQLSQVCRGQSARGEQFEIRVSSGGFFFHQTADLFKDGRQVADDIFCATNPTD